MRARLAALATIAAALVAPVPSAGAAPARWTEGECTDATGITVVIDFQELGGGVNVRCAPGPVTSGFAALDAAGISYQTTRRFSGFLCKIAGKPSNDPCIDTPPASAYWSYWLAPRGGQWCYSNWGAGNRTPPPGSVEGWSFSLNTTDSSSPPPRYAVPAPIPGAAQSLPANDCDPSGSAPKPTVPGPTSPPPTAPQATNPPATVPTAPGGTGGGSGGGSAVTPSAARSGAVVAGATTVPGAASVETAPIDPAATSTPVLGATTTADGATSTTTDSQTGETGGTGGTELRVDAASATGTVDLGDDGVDEGSPVGVIAALVVVGALAVGAVMIRRRARP